MSLNKHKRSANLRQWDYGRQALTLALSFLLSLLAPSIALSQGQNMSLSLAPHCSEIDRTKCAEFLVLDAERLTTATLAIGDILDIDVVLRGPKGSEVRAIRSWLQYEPTILEARSIELLPAVPSPTPEEQNIEAENGLIKIGGSTPQGVQGNDVPVARVTFRVLSAAKNTEIRFHDFVPGGNGHTAIYGTPSTESAPPPLLPGKPASLAVIVQGSGISSSSATSFSSSQSSLPSSTVQTSISSSMQSSAAQVGGETQGSSVFPLLQVQDVRVSTRDSMIFLGWQALRSAELQGYNVYYGTVSGRYIQRRSVTKTATSVILRDLEPGVTYYLAVRGVGRSDQESMYSQEVSVVVGKPETATSPLAGSIEDSLPPAENYVETRGGNVVSGETGLGSSFLWLLILSALIGTGFAFKRQFSTAHA